MQTPRTRGLSRAQSRGFISFGLVLPIIIALVALGGAGWYISQRDASPEQMTPETASTTQPIAVSMPSCTLSANPKMADWVLGADSKVTLTWSSESGTEAYLWLTVPRGGDIVLGTISAGNPVPLQGSEAVTVPDRYGYHTGYALVVKNSAGAAMCHTDGSKQFRTQEELDTPFKMG